MGAIRQCYIFLDVEQSPSTRIFLLVPGSRFLFHRMLSIETQHSKKLAQALVLHFWNRWTVFIHVGEFVDLEKNWPEITCDAQIRSHI